MIKYYCTKCENIVKKENYTKGCCNLDYVFEIDFDKSRFIKFAPNGDGALFFAIADDNCRMFIFIKKKDFKEINLVIE